MNTIPQNIAQLLEDFKTAEEERTLAQQIEYANREKRRRQDNTELYKQSFAEFMHLVPVYLHPYLAPLEVAEHIQERLGYGFSYRHTPFYFIVPGLTPMIMVIQHHPGAEIEEATLHEIQLPSVGTNDEFEPFYQWQEWTVVKFQSDTPNFIEKAMQLSRELQEKWEALAASASDKALAAEQKQQAELEYQQFQRDEMNQLFDLINNDPVLYHLTKAFAAIQAERNEFTEKLENSEDWIARSEERMSRKIKDLDDGLRRANRDLEDERNARYDIEDQLRKTRK